MAQQALWSGRFEEGMADSTLEFTTSLETDSMMAFFDVMGSLAHVRMLKKCGIIPARDADKIISGPDAVLASYLDATKALSSQAIGKSGSEMTREERKEFMKNADFAEDEKPKEIEL